MLISEFRSDETPQNIEEQQITVSALPVKGKRGRKRASEAKEDKKRLKAITEPKPSKSTTKGRNRCLLPSLLGDVYCDF